MLFRDISDVLLVVEDDLDLGPLVGDASLDDRFCKGK